MCGCVTIGPDPDRIRPAVWADGNVHAGELAGSSVALSIAEDALRMHLEPDALDLPAPMLARLRDVLFYIVPRISPDGAEYVLRTGRIVRSVPRDYRVDRGTPRWILGDVDGDGLALAMRVKDPGGELVEAPEFPGLLVERTLEDDGPFYKLYPGRRDRALRRQDHAVAVLRRRQSRRSQPQLSVVVGADARADRRRRVSPRASPRRAASSSSRPCIPKIFAWTNFHTFGGVLIRPPGDTPDSKMEQEDLAIFRQVEAWMTDHAGYPTVSGYDEFLYEPDKPLRGDLSEYAYHQRGAIAYAIELWDLFARLGMPRPPKFVQYYERVSRADLVKLAWWDRDENEGRVFPKWRPFAHPQLGDVEIGGIDPRVGIWNPPLHELGRRVLEPERRCSCASPRSRRARDREDRSQPARRWDHARRRPHRERRLSRHVRRAVGEAARLQRAALRDGDAARLRARRSLPHQMLGHLDGWGRGLHTGANMPAYPGTRGTTNAAWAIYLVRGDGVVDVRVGGVRTGFVTRAQSRSERGALRDRRHSGLQGEPRSPARVDRLLARRAIELWLAGDLVNRGPRRSTSCAGRRDIGDSSRRVLGNHDLHLLARAPARAERRSATRSTTCSPRPIATR